MYQIHSGITTGTYITLSNVQGITSTPSINGSFEVEYANADTLRFTTTSFSGTLTAGTNAQLRSSLTRSTFSISSINEQLYEKNKISLNISKINGQEPGNFGATNNGLIGGTKTYKNASDQWLGGVKDDDATSILTSTTNWILSGTQTNVDLLNTSSFQGKNTMLAPRFLILNTSVSDLTQDALIQIVGGKSPDDVLPDFSKQIKQKLAG